MDNEDTQNDAEASDIEFDKNEETQYDENIEDASAALQKLKAKLKICLAERSEYLDGWQRAKADLANARKNFDTERVKMFTYAAESTILEILPVVDSFEMAFANKAAWEAVEKNWRVGVEYIYNQLLKIVQDHGATQMNPIGEVFDPALYTAIETIPTDDASKDQHIVEVVTKGYKMHDKIIRPAQVKTAHYEQK